MNDCSIIIFDYKPTRKGENAKAFLQGFHGYLVLNGYSGYHVMNGVNNCGCMMHTRRYFVYAMPKYSSVQSSSIATEAVRYFDSIYREEGLVKDLTTEERYKERLEKIRPLLDEFFCVD